MGQKNQGTTMQVPVEISFHNLDSVDWAKKEINNHIARLEHIYGRLTSCRVRVDQRVHNVNKATPPVVHIDISLPGGKDIVVAHEPDHLELKYRQPDLHKAITEAFRIAERRLAEYKEQLKNPTAQARHEAANEFAGEITELSPATDSGFLLTKEGGLLYFHRNSLLSGNFAALKPGQRVSYVEAMGDTGPIASKVRLKTS